jgi:predicted nucleic acid-binding protein
MTLALDTDVLVSLSLASTPSHEACRRVVERELAGGGRLGLVPQVLHEFLHVCTDSRRFEKPIPMKLASSRIHDLWMSRDVDRIVPQEGILVRTLELLEINGLGRKRILDTALAATLEGAGVRRLATLNGQDYRVFPFLEVVEPW